MKYTILGASGFIGSHIFDALCSNHDCYAPNIKKESLKEENLGNVIYCLGVSDFINYPLKTIDAHVCILNEILKNHNFESLLYISSGRIYYDVNSTLEDNTFHVNPTIKNNLYNISKLQGEALCLAMDNPKIKIIRPSNVIGTGAPSNLFIPSLIKDAIDLGKITLHSTLDSQKDYVHVDDLVSLIPKIISKGKFQIYNIANGCNTSSKKIIDEIIRLTDCTLEIASDAKKFSSGQISIDRIKSEFDFVPMSVVEKIEELVTYYKNSK